MIVRFAIVTAAALSCAACANESSMRPMGLGMHGDIAKPEVTMAAPVPLPGGSAVKQTIGGKVLSAIALERVTGRKPDPRRFRELR